GSDGGACLPKTRLGLRLSNACVVVLRYDGRERQSKHWVLWRNILGHKVGSVLVPPRDKIFKKQNLSFTAKFCKIAKVIFLNYCIDKQEDTHTYKINKK
ncbi:hypothetical protein, partial [Proteus faecis]|uniref:hypothetical protein n=1 Tax=Proteus faecis TaxID=2050967 RepID=UPI003075BAD3